MSALAASLESLSSYEPLFTKEPMPTAKPLNVILRYDVARSDHHNIVLIYIIVFVLFKILKETDMKDILYKVQWGSFLITSIVYTIIVIMTSGEASSRYRDHTFPFIGTFLF